MKIIKACKATSIILILASFVMLFDISNVHASALVTNQSQIGHKRALFGLSSTKSPHGSIQPQVKPNTLHKKNTASRADLTLFAQHVYQDLLLRDPTTAEVSDWVDAPRANKTSKAELVVQLINGSEFTKKIAPVVRIYQTRFGFIKNPADLLFWLDLNNLGLPLENITNSMAEVEPFKRDYEGSSNRDFVISVYQTLFGRHPEPDGLEYWENVLESGKLTRAQFMDNLSESDEYQQKLPRRIQLTILTIGLLKRAPDQRELAFWLNNVDSKAELGFVNNLLVSDEYKSRFK